MELPVDCVRKIQPYIHFFTTEDALHDIVVCYLEVQKLPPVMQSRQLEIECAALRKKQFEEYWMKKHTISLDQCLGDSQTPLEQWFDPDNWH